MHTLREILLQNNVGEFANTNESDKNRQAIQVFGGRHEIVVLYGPLT
jgi:hypothetical protein